MTKLGFVITMVELMQSRRCLLMQGAQGDALHVLGCAAGYDLRWLIGWIAFLHAWIRAMGWASLEHRSPITDHRSPLTIGA
ncbi:IS1478 transposase [Xanthomonas fragariae]|uniref:IS1478 transposase n=1 Tax=Xanthomonas fragariae TaxID=48664 RepID=A0A1Y6HHD2_9XANT|nr:hypothetical protein BER92_07595 [Xanthomonas fragariae]AOD18024.1 hypothetical protein BER93_07615 [Xanthomonas fragariae]ENZ94842.1 IS1478 transposase [Xanthomonas fragariae LMG 25863]SMR02888.1 IS1478 transposase [Xanthomonas fragariae]